MEQSYVLLVGRWTFDRSNTFRLKTWDFIGFWQSRWQYSDVSMEKWHPSHGLGMLFTRTNGPADGVQTGNGRVLGVSICSIVDCGSEGTKMLIFRRYASDGQWANRRLGVHVRPNTSRCWSHRNSSNVMWRIGLYRSYRINLDNLGIITDLIHFVV